MNTPRYDASSRALGDWKKYGIGIDDPELVVDCGPLLRAILGTGVNPRDLRPVERAMRFDEHPYYKDLAAIKHPERGQELIDFQGWRHRSTTELAKSDLTQTVLTGDVEFLDELTSRFGADDLVRYDLVRKALLGNPKWKNDPSVPSAGDPFTRAEVATL